MFARNSLAPYRLALMGNVKFPSGAVLTNLVANLPAALRELYLLSFADPKEKRSDSRLFFVVSLWIHVQFNGMVSFISRTPSLRDFYAWYQSCST
jgi:hypothetical protein